MTAARKKTAPDFTGPWGERIAEITRRIADVARPRQILLFGSGARGSLGPESDIEKYGNQVGTIYRPALREGLVVYDAGS